MNSREPQPQDLVAALILGGVIVALHLIAMVAP